MKRERTLISKTDKIIEELEFQARPMTGQEIADLTGVDPRSVNSLINQYMKRGMLPEVQIVGHAPRENAGSLKNLYFIGEPAERGEVLLERQDKLRCEREAQLIVPFRDPMIFLTAGRNPHLQTA